MVDGKETLLYEQNKDGSWKGLQEENPRSQTQTIFLKMTQAKEFTWIEPDQLEEHDIAESNGRRQESAEEHEQGIREDEYERRIKWQKYGRKEMEKMMENWVWNSESGWEEVKQSAEETGEVTFATDGSMSPPSAGIGDKRTVSAACVTQYGQTSAIVEGNISQVMHGELLGIIMALIQARTLEAKKVHILSDYMSGIRKIRDYLVEQKSMNPLSDISGNGRS
jgi:hypothetical protein